MAENKDLKDHPLFDHHDSSFMAARRNSNFMSLLICFLITTNPDMGELSFLGFKFSAFNLTAIWIWIGLFWVYFYWRYHQYLKEVGNEILEETYKKAEQNTFPKKAAKYIDQETGEENKFAAVIADKLSSDRFFLDISSPEESWRTTAEVDILGEGGPRSYTVVLTNNDYIGWVKTARKLAHRKWPALVTLKAPGYLFKITMVVIALKILYEFYEFLLNRAVPPILLG